MSLGKMGCYRCGGWQFMKPLCGGIAGMKDSRIMKRCHCNDTPMQKLAHAFAWVGYVIGIANKQNVSYPKD